MKPNKQLCFIAALACAIGVQAALEAKTPARPIVQIAPVPETYESVYCFLDRGDFVYLAEVAENEIKKGGQVNPKWYEYLAIAKIHDDLNKEACKAFIPARTAARMNPNNPHFLSTLAMAMCFMQKPIPAMELAKKAIQKEPKNGRNHAVLAYALALTDRADPLAGEEMKNAIKLSPGDIDVNVLADAFFQVTTQDQGIDQTYARWIKHRPKSAYAYYKLADFQKDVHEDDNAIKNCLKSLSLNPGYEAPARVLAKIYYERREFKKGVDLLNGVLKIKGSSANYHTHGRLGQFYAELNQPQKSAEHLTQAIKLLVPNTNPNKFCKTAKNIEKNDLFFYTTWWEARARQYAKLGQVEKGVLSLSDLLSVLPDNSMALFARGQIYMQANKLDSALRDINALVSMDPDVSQWYKAKIDVLKKMGRKEEAMKVQKEHFAVEKFGVK